MLLKHIFSIFLSLSPSCSVLLCAVRISRLGSVSYIVHTSHAGLLMLLSVAIREMFLRDDRIDFQHCVSVREDTSFLGGIFESHTEFYVLHKIIELVLPPNNLPLLWVRERQIRMVIVGLKVYASHFPSFILKFYLMYTHNRMGKEGPTTTTWCE